MILKLSEEDEKRVNALEDKYERLLKEKKAEIDKLRDPADVPKEPDLNKYKGRDKTTLKKLSDERNRLFDEWEKAGSEEWRRARKEYFDLMNEQIEERRRLRHELELKQFSTLGGDKEKILADAKSQAEAIIDNRFNSYQKTIRTGKRADGTAVTRFSSFDLRVDDDNEIYLDAQTLIEDIKRNLSLHYDALKYDQNATKQLDQIVLDVVSSSPHVSDSAGTLGAYVSANKQIIIPKKPTHALAPIDKVSNTAFDGNPKALVEVIKKTKTRKPVYTMMTVDFEKLKDEGVTISGRRELTPYDREVFNAIVTLYVEGENEYLTTNMIYQQMTGKRDAHLSPKQAQTISESITKLMFSHIVIDATNEAQVDKRLVKVKYDSNMINAVRVTVSIHGQTVEAIQILRVPVLYDYARQKNQIGRYDVKLLDTPNNKNEDTIVLEGYLRRRILSIKGSSKLSPTILYDTIYKQVNLTGTDASLRVKKLRIRKTVKNALDTYKKEGFIKGYVENTHKGENGKVDSVTIRV